MLHHLSLVLFCLPFGMPAQNFVYDNVLFWDSINLAERIDLIQPPGGQPAPLAFRRYYGDRQDVREEFLRAGADRWLFNSYDTTTGYRTRRGLVQVDSATMKIDTTMTFDPETYDAILDLQVTYRLSPVDAWHEVDAEGYTWDGCYENGRKNGPWTKNKSYDGYCDCRNLLFDHGALVKETFLNLAAARDTAAVVKALTNSIWVVFPSDALDRATLTQEIDGKLALPGTQSYYGQYGKSRFRFPEAHAVELYLPYGNDYKLSQKGSWTISDAMELKMSWEEGGVSVFKILSLVDREMILEGQFEH